MKLLVDTHVLVWLSTCSDTLPGKVVHAIEQAEVVFASPLSVYEIEYKRDRDRELAQMPDDLAYALSEQGLVWLPLTAAHMAKAACLPRLHKDPWDRMLVGQAMVEGLVLVTIDAKIARYDVPVLW